MRGRELCDAATANFVVHASWAARRNPERPRRVDRVADDGGLGAAHRHVQRRLRRPASGRRGAGDRAPRRRPLPRRRPAVLLVGRSRRRAGGPRRTTDRGRARAAGDELAMALELSTVAPGPAGPEGIEIREATIARGHRSLRADQRRELAAARRGRRDLLPGRRRERCSRATVPRRSSSRSATASPWPRSSSPWPRGVGGIYNLSTRVAHRRRGIGGALLDGVPRARSWARTVVLQASAAGAGLYRSFGFREFGLIEELKPSHS